jgi:hypothetical protein
MRRWRLLLAIPAVAALPLLGVTAASAAPAATHAQASPDADGCESGFAILQNALQGYYFGQSEVKVGQPIETTKGNNYCWQFPANGTASFIVNEAGYCAGWDTQILSGVVALQDCLVGASYQQWYLVNDGGNITLENEYAVAHKSTYQNNLWMEGTGLDGPVILGDGAITWHDCEPPGPC